MEKLEMFKVSLLHSLKNGDKDAFKSIFDEYQKRLYCFIFSITKSDYLTEEILQEVFVKVWTKRHTIDPSLSFSSFIHTIAKNHTYNYLRNVANRESLKQELWKNITHFNRQTEDTILSTEYEDILNGILMNIPKQKRSIFILSKQEGRSNQEIAELMGISPKTVKNHLWKTLQTIRIQLQPYIMDTAATVPFFIFFIF